MISISLRIFIRTMTGFHQMFSYISLPPFNVLREDYGGAFSKDQPHFHFRNEPCLARCASAQTPSGTVAPTLMDGAGVCVCLSWHHTALRLQSPGERHTGAWEGRAGCGPGSPRPRVGLGRMPASVTGGHVLARLPPEAPCLSNYHEGPTDGGSQGMITHDSPHSTCL